MHNAEIVQLHRQVETADGGDFTSRDSNPRAISLSSLDNSTIKISRFPSNERDLQNSREI